MKRRALGAGLLLLLAAAPSAHADNLGALVWLVFIWPVGLLFALVLVVLAVPAGLRLRHRRASPRLARALVVLAVLFDVAFTGLALAAEDTPARFALANIGAFQVVALPALALGAALERRTPPA